MPSSPAPTAPPPPEHIRSHTPASLNYWRTILSHCTPSTLHLRAPTASTRDIFALPHLLIKSSHLQPTAAPSAVYSDRNELAALSLLRESGTDLHGIQVPEIYFAGELDGQQVLIQSRLPGVPLDVKWPALSNAQRTQLRAQVRRFMRALHRIRPPQGTAHPQYVYADPAPMEHRGLQEVEKMLLFDGEDAECGFVHNDLQTTNILVDEAGERVVGVVDWEMAGWFGWNRAAEVHKRIRTPAVGGGVAEGMALGEGVGERGEGAEGEIWGALYDCGLEGDV